MSLLTDSHEVSKFPNAISRAIFYNKYSRWDEAKKRRETQTEAVLREFTFLDERFTYKGGIWQPGEREQVYTAMDRFEALASMRVFWSAGPALARNHIMAYNCAYMAVNRLEAFPEALYILMSGTGVGYSVEGQYVDDLPRIRKQKGGTPDVFVIPDTTEGWADALKFGIEHWWNGQDVVFDGSQVRPEGTILKTKGGRASGVQPLLNALRQIRKIILDRQGRRITSLMAHDMMCLLAQVVVVGGIRRSSLICLSDLDDLGMRRAKHGEFWNATPWRAMANNSVAYNTKPTTEELLDEWISLMQGKSGERGMFNREAFRITSPRRSRYGDVGTNPCGEILLRDRQFCNLSEIVCRQDDIRDTLVAKTKIAAILGTIQASLTDFPYISSKWKENCEDEALLGLSATGEMDCPAFRDPDVQRELKRVSIETNADFAKRMGINQSAAITCVKPSGTASLLVNSSSGLHTRWSKFYIRRIRLNASDKMLELFRIMGMVINPDPVTPGTFTVDFPMKSPEGAITRHDLSALEQLEYWLQVKTNFTEHNPSCTIYVKDAEWIQVVAWVDAHWNLIGGLSFLPSDDHIYELAPHSEITEDEYHRLMETFPQFTDDEFANALAMLEDEDNTTGSQELACVSGVCSTV